MNDVQLKSPEMTTHRSVPNSDPEPSPVTVTPVLINENDSPAFLLVAKFAVAKDGAAQLVQRAVAITKFDEQSVVQAFRQLVQESQKLGG